MHSLTQAYEHLKGKFGLDTAEILIERFEQQTFSKEDLKEVFATKEDMQKELRLLHKELSGEMKRYFLWTVGVILAAFIANFIVPH